MGERSGSRLTDQYGGRQTDRTFELLPLLLGETVAADNRRASPIIDRTVKGLVPASSVLPFDLPVILNDPDFGRQHMEERHVVHRVVVTTRARESG